MNKLQITFGEPEHHWLPVHLIIADFDLEFEASPILNDPIEQLIETLIMVSEGIDAEVLWFLEPLEYIFRFKLKSGGVSLLITVKAEESSESEVYQFTGDFHAVVLPFWRAIKARFANNQFPAMHWSSPSAERLQKLDIAIKSRKHF